MYLPDYTWEVIKEFLLRKKHPTALIMKRYTFYYTKPQIFLSQYYQLRNGMFIRMDKPCIQCIPRSLENSISFLQYVLAKQIARKQRCL